MKSSESFVHSTLSDDAVSRDSGALFLEICKGREKALSEVIGEINITHVVNDLSFGVVGNQLISGITHGGSEFLGAFKKACSLLRKGLGGTNESIEVTHSLEDSLKDGFLFNESSSDVLELDLGGVVESASDTESEDSSQKLT